MKLSIEEIQFIDNYLKNNNVVYVDIRQEMIDHIATAVEEKTQQENLNFYDAFKDYMIENKSFILKNNKEFIGLSLDAIKKYFLFLIKPYNLLLGILLIFIFKNFVFSGYFTNGFSFKNLVFITIMAIAIFQILFTYVYLKKRFYSIEKVGSILTIIYFFQMFFLPIDSQEKPSSLTITFFVFIFLSYILFFTSEIIKFNKHKFNYI